MCVCPQGNFKLSAYPSSRSRKLQTSLYESYGLALLGLVHVRQYLSAVSTIPDTGQQNTCYRPLAALSSTAKADLP